MVENDQAIFYINLHGIFYRLGVAQSKLFKKCFTLQDGTTPLLVACHHDRKDAIRVLLEYQPQVDLPRKVV